MRRWGGPGLLLIVMVLVGCTADPVAQTAPTPVATPATIATSSAAPPALPRPPRPCRGHRPQSRQRNPNRSRSPGRYPISVQALIEKKYDSRALKLGRQIGAANSYKRYLITYRGDGERISGVMNVPDGKGPFPVLVLNHGYIDPRHLRSRASWPASTITWLGAAEWVCASTTAATPPRPMTRTSTTSCGCLRGGHDQRGQGRQVLQAEVPGPRPGGRLGRSMGGG